ncbi:MAG: membrane protein insertase YidC [Longimicrobiales bacterium]
MESGRFLLAVILMIAVMVITNMLFAPDRPAPGDMPADSVTIIDTTGAQTAPVASDSPGMVAAPTQADADTAAPASPPEVAAAPAVDTIWIETPLLELGFRSDGAVVSARLLEYETFSEGAAEGERVQLAYEGDTLLEPVLTIGGPGTQVAQVPLRFEAADDSAGTQLVRFAWRDATREAVLTWMLGNDYTLHATLQTSGFATAPQLQLGLPSTLRSNEADPNEDRRSLAYVMNGPQDGIESVNIRSVDEPRAHNGPFTWVAVKSKYFLVAAMSGEGSLPFGGVRAQPTGVEHTADIVATLPLAADGTVPFSVYVGPQVADRLAAFGNGLEDVNPYGWRLLRPILRPIGHAVTWALVWLHTNLNIGYGWVLILFGVIIRLLLWPLNARSMRAQLKNMELQPRIKEIQEKYKSNPEVMQKEMMKLYKEGFNPLGGCLPLLIPFPVLIALFFVFQGTIEFRGVEFLWLPDLSRYDPLYILPVLLGGSMFLQQFITMKSTPAHLENPQMKMMMYFMPIFMTVIFLRFASGLNLYYVSQNIASLPQQFQLMRERKKWHASRK